MTDKKRASGEEGSNHGSAHMSDNPIADSISRTAINSIVANSSDVDAIIKACKPVPYTELFQVEAKHQRKMEDARKNLENAPSFKDEKILHIKASAMEYSSGWNDSADKFEKNLRSYFEK